MREVSVVFMTNRFSSVVESLYFCRDILLTGIIYHALPGSVDRQLMDFCSMHKLSLFHSIDEFISSAVSRPDFLAVYSLHKILTEDEIKLPKIAALNLHPSMLPLYKGPNPLQEQFEDRVEFSGFTVHKITSDIDGGKIVSQKMFKIDYSLSFETIRKNSLRNIGGPLLCSAIIAYNKNPVQDSNTA